MKKCAASDKLLLKILRRLYPNPASELNFRAPYELIVCVALSAQCTDKKVNEVTPLLFKRYPSFPHLAKAKSADLQRIIRPINYYRTKSKNLIAMARMVVDVFGGSLPQTIEELKRLPGVGQKTASVVICELGITPAFPVDTHVFRLAKRLALARGNTPAKVEEELKLRFHSRHWRDLHLRLILHGRRVCKAQRPLCNLCRLVTLCPIGQTG